MDRRDADATKDAAKRVEQQPVTSINIGLDLFSYLASGYGHEPVIEPWAHDQKALKELGTHLLFFLQADFF